MYTVKLAKIIFLVILYVTMVTDSKSGNHRGLTFRIMQYVLPTKFALVLLVPRGIETIPAWTTFYGESKLHHAEERERRKLVSLALFGRENIWCKLANQSNAKPKLKIRFCVIPGENHIIYFNLHR